MSNNDLPSNSPAAGSSGSSSAPQGVPAVQGDYVPPNAYVGAVNQQGLGYTSAGDVVATDGRQIQGHGGFIPPVDPSKFSSTLVGALQAFGGSFDAPPGSQAFNVANALQQLDNDGLLVQLNKSNQGNFFGAKHQYGSGYDKEGNSYAIIPGDIPGSHRNDFINDPKYIGINAQGNVMKSRLNHFDALKNVFTHYSGRPTVDTPYAGETKAGQSVHALNRAVSDQEMAQQMKMAEQYRSSQAKLNDQFQMDALYAIQNATTPEEAAQANHAYQNRSRFDLLTGNMSRGVFSSDGVNDYYDHRGENGPVSVNPLVGAKSRTHNIHEQGYSNYQGRGYGPVVSGGGGAQEGDGSKTFAVRDAQGRTKEDLRRMKNQGNQDQAAMDASQEEELRAKEARVRADQEMRALIRADELGCVNADGTINQECMRKKGG